MSFKCQNCGAEIGQDRIESLLFLNKPASKWFCIECQKTDDFKIKAVYTGLSGISNLILTDKVDNTPPKWERIEDEPEINVENEDIPDE